MCNRQLLWTTIYKRSTVHHTYSTDTHPTTPSTHPNKRHSKHSLLTNMVCIKMWTIFLNKTFLQRLCALGSITKTEQSDSQALSQLLQKLLHRHTHIIYTIYNHNTASLAVSPCEFSWKWTLHYRPEPLLSWVKYSNHFQLVKHGRHFISSGCP